MINTFERNKLELRNKLEFGLLELGLVVNKVIDFILYKRTFYATNGDDPNLRDPQTGYTPDQSSHPLAQGADTHDVTPVDHPVDWRYLDDVPNATDS